MFAFALRIAICGFLLAAPAASALAAPTQLRAWVSGLGADASNCGAVTTPCRTFQYAHDAIVAAGGSIFVKDSAGYGPITISKSISILNGDGALAMIQPTAGAAITISAPTLVTVMLKGLTLDGAGVASNGIVIEGPGAGGQVEIVNCTIRNFGTAQDLNPAGVAVIPGVGDWRLGVEGSTISQNIYAGIYILTTGTATVKGDISASTLSQNGAVQIYILSASPTISIDIRDSTLSGSAGIGALAQCPSCVLSLHRTLVTALGTGVAVQGNGIILLDQTAVRETANDVLVQMGTVYTQQNNSIGSVTGALTPAPLQ